MLRDREETSDSRLRQGSIIYFVEPEKLIGTGSLVVKKATVFTSN